MKSKSVLMLAILILGAGSASAAWNVEHVGNTNIDTGDNCSIAVDALGHPYVAYAAKWKADLYYACKTGATWTVQVLKTNCYPLDRASINVDTNSRPHICFAGFIGGTAAVYHAYSQSGASWTYEKIDNSNSGGGLDSTFDSSGKLHVSYFAGGDSTLRYAVKSGGSWSVTSFTNMGSASSIAVDSLGNPHISFVRQWPAGICYAAKTSAAWSVVAIDTNLALIGNTAIAVDLLGRPHMSWLDWQLADERVRYAYWNGSSWQKEYVEGAVEQFNDLVVKPDGTPVVSYFYKTATNAPYRLYVAEKVGGVWQKQVVEQNGATNDLDVIQLGMALDSSITPHLAYCNNRGMGAIHNLKYATNPSGRPFAPTNITASDGTYGDRVRISWTVSSGATGYEVWRHSTNSPGYATRIAPNVAETSFDDSTATPNVIYVYWLKAINANGASAFSLSDSGYASNAPPAAPTGIMATDGTYPNQVQVTWSASSGATGYEVWRFTNSNPNLASNIARGIANSPYNDTNVIAGRVYYYWLKATNAGGASALSSSNSGFAQLTPPPAPTGVLATDGSYPNKVRVTWTASSGATGYEVWRFTSNNSNSSSRLALGLGGSPYDDTTVIAGTNYYYWVKATNAGGTSAFSLSDSGYASNAIPSAPTGVSASDGTYSDRIRVSWTPSAGAIGYEVWRNTNNVSGSATKIAPSIVSSPYDDLTASQGITHYYWIKATNASGASAFSASDAGLRASTSFSISGTVSYVGPQTGMVQVMASPYFVGQSNIALSLDGVDDAMVVTNPTTALRLTNTHSFCAWINLGAMPAGNQATMLMKYDDTNKASFVASIEKSTGRLRYSIGASDTAYSTSTISTASGWTHIAFTHDGSAGRWYVDGSLDSSMSFPSLQRWGDGPLYIGRAIDLQSFFDRFGGGIDEVSLWKRTLNQAEIQALMTNSLTGSEVGLAGYWNFDDDTGIDLTTNSNDGQLVYGATTTVRQAVGLGRSITLASPGVYAVADVLAGEYTLYAYRDSSGDGSHDSWEAYGTYPANPLSVTGNMADIDIILQDPVTDSDGDGVSDYDEIYLHGTLWNNPDTDDDGMPDGDEVLAGSSPTNDVSMFGFADSQPVPEGGGVVVSWPSLSNRVYRLERTTNLMLDFEPLVNDLPADPPVNSYTDDTPNVIGVYKVGVRME